MQEVIPQLRQFPFLSLEEQKVKKQQAATLPAIATQAVKRAANRENVQQAILHPTPLYAPHTSFLLTLTLPRLVPNFLAETGQNGFGAESSLAVGREGAFANFIPKKAKHINRTALTQRILSLALFQDGVTIHLIPSTMTINNLVS